MIALDGTQAPRATSAAPHAVHRGPPFLAGRRPGPGWGAPTLLMGMLFVISGCGPGDQVPVPGAEGALKSTGEARADRRLYDGAPPVIPHDDFGADCSACHDSQGTPVRGIGFAPASPHEETRQAGATLRCRQCHVFALTDDLFAGSEFRGMRQDLWRGNRLYDGAPPTIPHKVFMRENCGACHAGPGARPEIMTSHPERTRCRQCHVPVITRDAFSRTQESGPESSEEP